MTTSPALASAPTTAGLGLSRRTLLAGAAAIGAGALAGTAEPSAQAAVPAFTHINYLTPTRVLLTAASSWLLTSHHSTMLLPKSYATSTKRYPVVYLLHGSGADHSAWLNGSSIAQLAAAREVIVVMPDGGRGGWYNNHLYSTVGRQFWLNFHLAQLIPMIDARFRTIAKGAARAVAGASMGGYGALNYAATRPDLFHAVSSYSGACDLRVGSFPTELRNEPMDDGENAGAIFGLYPRINTAELTKHNPVFQASRLAGKRVRLYAGTASGYESSMLQASRNMAAALKRAGVPYGLTTTTGTHSWANFSHELALDFGGLVGSLAPAR